MDRGSAYGWLSVRWEDGPAYGTVRAICDRYESSRFDGMDDGYHATGNSQWSCCGVICQRDYSEHAIGWAISLIGFDVDGEMFIDHAGVQTCQQLSWETPRQVARRWLERSTLSLDTTTAPVGRRFADDAPAIPSAPARRAC